VPAPPHMSCTETQRSDKKFADRRKERMMDRVGGICKDRMAPHERIGALFMGQTPDRVPFNPFAMGFSSLNCGYTVESFYNDPQKSLDAQLWTAEQYGYEPVVLLPLGRARHQSPVTPSRMKRMWRSWNCRM
jgi:hypothetical protein